MAGAAVFHSLVVIEALDYKWLRCSPPARLEVDEKHLNFTHRVTLGHSKWKKK